MVSTPRELSEREFEGLKFMSDLRNWRPPQIAEFTRHLGHKNRQPAWAMVKKLVEKGYLDHDLKPTQKAIKHLAPGPATDMIQRKRIIKIGGSND